MKSAMRACGGKSKVLAACGGKSAKDNCCD